MDANGYVSQSRFPEFALWDQLAEKRMLVDFTLELTARCNNDCRHCYINLPAGDAQAASKELTLAEISSIADQAVELGALWCLISGGEPLLRRDFPEIYLALKRKGLLVSVFTNACLVTREHVELFRRYPPRDIEISVYGVTRETYEGVTRKPGSYAAFRRGLNLLLEAGIPVRLKAMAIRSTVHELSEIAAFCREHTKDFFRFDPLLNLRHDRDHHRNAEIIAERLSPAAIVAVERGDEKRFRALENGCNQLIFQDYTGHQCNHLFHCGAGKGGFVVSYEGIYRLCSSLMYPGTTFDLRQGSVKEAWEKLTPQVHELRSTDPDFLERCRRCPIVNLCLWCPAHADLECGRMDGWSEYFCEVAHARAAAIQGHAGETSEVATTPAAKPYANP